MNIKQMLYTLWEKVNTPNIIIVDNVSVGEITLNSAGAGAATVDVSTSIPSGYELAVPILRTTGSYWCYCYSLSRTSANTVTINIMRAMSSNTKTTPSIALICRKK